MKDSFNDLAGALSAAYDAKIANKENNLNLSRLELDLEKINRNIIGDPENKKTIDSMVFMHELGHALTAQKFPENDLVKNFRHPRPRLNIGILPPDDVPPVVAQAPQMTDAERASQVASVMAEGVQGKISAPQTARFQRKTL